MNTLPGIILAGPRWMRALVVVLPSALLFGCGTIGREIDRIPEGSAESFVYRRASTFSSTTVEATSFAKTPDAVTADRIAVVVTAPWLGRVETEVKGYRRARTAPPADPSSVAIRP